MRPDDFFFESYVGDGLDSVESLAVVREFNRELADRLRQRPQADIDDLDAAIALVQLVHDDLERFGTDGGQRLSDDDLGSALRTLRAVLKRLGISFEVPFRSFTTFKSYWGSKGMSGSWQARRTYLQGVFDAIH